MVIASLPYTVLAYEIFHWDLHFQIAGETYTVFICKKHKNKPTEQIDTNDLE